MGVALVLPCFFLWKIDSYYKDIGGFYLKHHEFIQAVEANPVIAAVKSDEGLRHCLDTDIGIVFTLYGDLGSIENIVKQIKDAGKIAMVHIHPEPDRCGRHYYHEVQPGTACKEPGTQHHTPHVHAGLHVDGNPGPVQPPGQRAAGHHGASAGNASAGCHPESKSDLPGAGDGQRSHFPERGDYECTEKWCHLHLNNQ